MTRTVPGTAQKGEKPRDLRPVLLAVAVATAGVMPPFLTGGLAVQIRGELGFNAGYLGLAVAVFFAASSLFSVVSGRIVERIGSARGMRLSALVGASAMLAVAALADSLWALMACLVLGGLGNAFAHPATHLLLAREVPQGSQGFAFGIKQAAIPAATMVAGISVPVLALTVGWRYAFALCAVLALVVAFLVPKGGAGDVRRPRQRAREARLSNAPLAALVLLALGVGLGSAAATPLGAFVVESAVSSGVQAGAAGLLLALGGGVSIVVRVTFGRLADGMQGGRLRIVAGMLLVGILGFAILAGGSSALIVVGVVLAFGAGWGWPGLFNFAVVKSNPSAPAAATGITQTGASGGAGVGPLLFGLVVDASSYGVAWLCSAAVALLAAAAVIAGRRAILRDMQGSREIGGGE